MISKTINTCIPMIFKKLQSGVKPFCKYFVPSLLVSSFMLCSCVNDTLSFEELENYYAESLGLRSVSLDSIASFSAKVDLYTSHIPAAKQSPLYPKIQANIHAATAEVTLRVIIIPDWGDEINVDIPRTK